MFRKCLLVFVSAALLLAAVGCQCAGTTTPASPSPSATIMPTSAPEPTANAAASASPDLSASPGLSEGIEALIPDFMEGTEVKEDEIPDVVNAVQEKHKDAKILSIKHAMQQNMQVYAVEIEADGKTETVYVKPDGTLLEQDAASGAGASGEGGATNGSAGGATNG